MTLNVIYKIAADISGLASNVEKTAQLTGNLDKRMSGLQQTVSLIGKSLAGLFTIGAITAAVNKVMDFASAMTDVSARTGVSVKALQEFQFAGAQVGVSLDTITTAIGQMQNRLASGDKSAVGALTFLKIGLDEIRRMAPEDQFRLIASRLGSIEDPAARAKVAMDLMGRGALEVMPLIVSNLDEMIQKANDLGVVLDKNTIAAMDDLGDTMSSLEAVGTGVIANVMKPMVPLFQALGNALLGVGPLMEKLQIAFEQFISIAAGGAKTLINVMLTFQKSTNVFGMNDKAISRLTEGSAQLAEIQKQLSTHATPVTRAIEEQGRAIRPLTVDYDRVGSASSNAAKAADRLEAQYRDLRNEVGVRQREAWLASQKAMTDFDRVVITETIPSLQNLQTEIPVEEMLEFDRVTTLKVIPSLGKMNDTLDEAPPKLSKFGGLLGDLNDIFQRAFEGGGGLGGAIQSFATNLGKTLLAMIPVVGPFISQFAGAIVAGFKKIFGGLFGGEEKKVNPLRQSFIDAAGGLDVLAEKARLAGTDLRALLNADTVKKYEQAINDLNKALEFQEDAMELLRVTAEKYGFTLQELGPALARQELDEQAQQLFKDWEILNAAGIDTVAIATRMAESVNTYVQNALLMGMEVPAAMRPMLEQMAQMGLLTDSAGNIITDLEAAGVSFAMTMSEGFKALIDEVKALTDAISRGLGLAIKNIPPVTVPVEGPEMPETIPMQHGGMGLVTKPTMFLAGEAGPEEFAFSGAGRRFSGGGDIVIHTHSYVGGREVAHTVERIASNDLRMRKRLRAA